MSGENSYLYDWSGEEPVTDDPAMAGRLTWYHRGCLTVDGEPVDWFWLKRARTGPEGWAEYAVPRARDRRTGQTVEGMPLFQIYDQDRDGKKRMIYEEIIVPYRKCGDVVFSDDAGKGWYDAADGGGLSDRLGSPLGGHGH